MTLIHVLAGDPPEDGTVRTRSTVRVGTVAPGDELWFEDVGCKRHLLIVVSVEPTPRWSTIVFAGSPEDLAAIDTGTYIHSRPTESHGNADQVLSTAVERRHAATSA